MPIAGEFTINLDDRPGVLGKLCQWYCGAVACDTKEPPQIKLNKLGGLRMLLVCPAPRDFEIGC